MKKLLSLSLALTLAVIMAAIILSVIVAQHMGVVASYTLSGGVELDIVGLKINGAVHLEAPTGSEENSQ